MGMWAVRCERAGPVGAGRVILLGMKEVVVKKSELYHKGPWMP